MIKYIVFIGLFLVSVSCSDFLEPKSQNEYVPENAVSLNEMLLGEAYARADYSNCLFSLQTILDDDVTCSTLPYPVYSGANNVEGYHALYSWQPDMFTTMENVGLYNDNSSNPWKAYYDLILGEDLTAYPSYYEPWGYTPLESVAFRVPTITTDLAGFGRWVNSLKGQAGIDTGVEVLHRSDYNYSDVADGIKDTIAAFAGKEADEVKNIRKCAAQVAEQALWKHFIQHYYEAYDLALKRAMARQQVAV